MTWGTPSLQRHIDRLRQDDASFVSLYIMKSSGRILDKKELELLFQALETNSHLQDLYLAGHALTLDTTQVLAKALEMNKSLRCLRVGDSSLGGDLTILAKLCEGVQRNKGLEEWDLDQKRLDNKGLAMVLDACAGHATLKKLIISRNPQLSQFPTSTKVELSVELLDFTDCNFSEVEETLLSSMPLKHLLLNGNPISPSGAFSLGKNLCHLESLELCFPTPADHAGGSEESVGDSLLRGLLANAAEFKLKRLWLDGTGLSLVELLAGLLSKHPELSQLRLRKNTGLNDAAVVKFVQALSFQDAKLSHLDIAENGLGFAALFELLKITSLKRISFFGNSLNYLPELPFSAEKTAQLQRLDLGACGLSSAAFGNLVPVLAKMPSLGVLELGGNLSIDGNSPVHSELEEQAWQVWREKLVEQIPELKVRF